MLVLRGSIYMATYGTETDLPILGGCSVSSWMFQNSNHLTRRALLCSRACVTFGVPDHCTWPCLILPATGLWWKKGDGTSPSCADQRASASISFTEFLPSIVVAADWIGRTYKPLYLDPVAWYTDCSVQLTLRIFRTCRW